MPPPWVLLKDSMQVIDEGGYRTVFSEGYETIGCWTGALMVEDEAPVGGTSERAAAAIHLSDKQPAAGGQSDDAHRMARTVKLIARRADPPKVSSFTLAVLARKKTINTASVECTNNNIILFATHSFYKTYLAEEYYLIYNASRNSLIIIPKPPTMKPHTGTFQASISPHSSGAVVLRKGDEGSYLLADLYRTSDDMSKALLWLWNSKSTGGWVQKKVDLPAKAVSFVADQTFSLKDKYACWVDLLGGILICDVLSISAVDDVELSFIPLPLQYVEEDFVHRYGRGSPREHRGMAVVRDSIKLVCLDGYFTDQVEITTWALLDLKQGIWEMEKKLRIKDLWNNEIVSAKQLEGYMPCRPFPSEYEDDMVYLFVDKAHCRIDPDPYFCNTPTDDEQYMIAVDMQRGQLQGCVEVGFGDFMSKIPRYCSFHTSPFFELLQSLKNKGEEQAHKRPTKIQRISAAYPAETRGH